MSMSEYWQVVRAERHRGVAQQRLADERLGQFAADLAALRLGTVGLLAPLRRRLSRLVAGLAPAQGEGVNGLQGAAGHAERSGAQQLAELRAPGNAAAALPLGAPPRMRGAGGRLGPC